jgi:tetratricopeptide (TPR) repeat protein
MTESKRSQYEPVLRSPEEWVAARDRQAAEAVKERACAEKLWRRLAAGDRSLWRDHVLGEPEFQVWAFCEKLCNESAELADDDPDPAFELAQLALELVPKTHADEKLLCGIQQYVWMHIGNAFRARGDWTKAEESFKQAGEFLLGSMAGSLPSVILRERLAGLEAALLRDQGDLVEALRKIHHAISLAGDRGVYRSSLLLEEARLHRRLGRPEEALQVLGWAERDAQSSIEGRLLVRIEIELGNARCDLGRHAEVEKVPGRVRKTAESFPLERARLLCLEGRVAAGLGRLEKARAILKKARTEIDARVVPELVLLSLETGALCVRQGKTTELKSLAEQTLQLVEAADLKGAVAATLKLWCRLAARDKLSFEHATRFVCEWTHGPAAR